MVETVTTTTYKEVCTGTTNHAEVVKLDFDEKIISYEKILNIFFKFMIQRLLILKGQILEHNIEVKYFILMKSKKNS